MAAVSLVTSVPVIPMATPMSALFKGRGVVHPVPGHGHHLPLGLEDVHQAQLVLRGHPGKDLDLLEGLAELRHRSGGSVPAR